MTEGGFSGRRVTDRKFDTRDAGTDNFLHMIVLLQIQRVVTIIAVNLCNQKAILLTSLDLVLPPSFL
jgi:hypothetical protein